MSRQNELASATFLNCQLFFLLFITSTSGQWLNPWLEGPPINSPANGHVQISGSTINAEEGILAGNVIAVLRFNPDTQPVLNSCFNLIKLGTANDGRADMILLRNLDFESGYSNRESCIVFIDLNDGTVPEFKTATIQVIDLNDNKPYITNPPSQLEYEENKLGTVYTFQAEDADVGSELRFSMRLTVGDESHFSLDEKKGELAVIKELDYDSGQFYLFVVTVTDPGGNSSSIQVVLDVIDIKDMNPIWVDRVTFVNIKEELEPGTVVATVVARDGDSFNDVIIYSLIDPKNSFAVDRITGQVSVTQLIDRDVIDFDPYFDLRITATCQNWPDYKSETNLTVFIDDVDDNLPTFNSQIYQFQVDEHYFGRLSQYDISVSDPDLRDGGTYTISLEGSIEIIQYLEISPQSGRNNGTFFLTITNEKLFDYEDENKRDINFKIVATATLGGRSEADVTISSNDINDNDPIFLQSEYRVNIDENKGVNDFVIKVVATDGDINSLQFGPSSIRYSFVENFDAARYLRIDNQTGEITTAINIDRESIGSTLTYTLQAIDQSGASDGRRSTAVLAITIIDTNDYTPVFDPPSTVTFAISEDATTETAVTTVSATDRDENPNLKLSINWTNSKFYKNRAIVPDRPDEWEKTFVLETTSQENVNNIAGVVKVGNSVLPPGNCEGCTSGPLDWESFDSVQICLTVTDDSTVEPNDDKDEIFIVIDITDVNDNKPVFDTVGTFVIAENGTTAIGTGFGFVRAIDIDQNNTIRYTINSECSQLTIDPTNGQLKLRQIVDREEMPTIECIVTATDSGTPARSSSTPISVRVEDINDNKPSLTVSINPIVIYECAEASQKTTDGLLLSRLQATDLDSGVYGNVSYLMFQNNLEGNDEFDIDLISGDMFVKNCALIDFEKKPSFSFLVEARDYYRSGVISGSLSDFQQVNVILRDLNDNSPVLDDPGIGCFGENPLESLTMGETAATIKGTDRDGEGPNKWMTFILNDQKRIGDQLPACLELFSLVTNQDNSTARLTVAVPNMLDCKGEYDINVKACDQGDDILGVKCSSDVIYRICVQDVNNNAPQFQFPDPGGSVVGVLDNSTVGNIVKYDGNNDMIFQATDKDEGANGLVRYTWKNETYNTIFNLDPSSGIVTLGTQLDRDIASHYNLIVVAEDNGVPYKNKTETSLRINVRLSTERQSYFQVNSQSLSFMENRIETHSFEKAIHPDNGDNLYPGESEYDFCYFIICGNSQDFEIADKKVNQLATKRMLDREIPPDTSYVVVMTTNDCDYQSVIRPCTDIDVQENQYLNITVQIADENDCLPEYGGSLAGGITTDNKRGDPVYKLDVSDRDENEVIGCAIMDQVDVSDSSLSNVANQFRIENSTKNIIIDFDVQSEMKGYFTITVKCQDKAGQTSQVNIKLYIVTEASKVDIYFDDPVEEVEEKRFIIENIFTARLGYLCNVDKVVNSDGPNGYVTAFSHFINTTSNEPALYGDVIARANEGNTQGLLQTDCEDVGLNLNSVGQIAVYTDNSEAVFQVLFIVSCVAIVAMIILIVYLVIRRAELDRRVKALSSTRFGSQNSGINRIGETAPNSNVYATEGSNPIYRFDLPSYSTDENFDNMSESSGDSILIGVENNPEFKGYKPYGKDHSRSNKEVPSMPFENVSRRNPLMDMDSLPEPNHPPPPPPPRSVKRPAPTIPPIIREDETDIEEIEGALNSNFTFGKASSIEL